MNISEEKEHIYSIMRELTLERRKITDMYFDLKKRLDELDALQRRGLEDLSLEGYVDLYNKDKKESSIANITREMNRIVKNIENEHEPKEKEIIPKLEIEKEKDKMPKIRSSISIDKAAGVIASILKEKGAPMQIKDIHKSMEEKMDTEIKIANLRNNILPRASNINPKIQRAMRGYYQYVN